MAPADEVKNLRYLKWLVTILTVTMIAGFLTIVGLFVMRFADMSRVELPDVITLPDGARAKAFTRGEGWFAVVTDANEILIYSRVTARAQLSAPLSRARRAMREGSYGTDMRSTSQSNPVESTMAYLASGDPVWWTKAGSDRVSR